MLCALLAAVMLLGVVQGTVSAEASYAIKVSGGITKSGSEQIYTAARGKSVTLTAGKSTTGREFYKWEVVSPAGLSLSDEKSASTTFTMPDGEVELRAIFKSATTVMTSKEFVAKAVDIARNYKTLYVMGCFGAPLNDKTKPRYTSNYSYNAQPERAAMINAASPDTFGFDCVCLIKGILWGWNGDMQRSYGGAMYAINGVPDIGTDAMIGVCSEVTTEFDHKTMVPGEAVWMAGHIGIYIGDGLAVECTPKWSNDVQITACNKDVSGYNRRNWSKHGFLPYIDYGANSEADLDQTGAPPVERDFSVSVASTAACAGSTVSYSGAKHFNSQNGPGYVRAMVNNGSGQGNPMRPYKVTMDLVINDLSVADSSWNNDEGVIMAMLGSGKTMGYNSAARKFFISGGGGGWLGNPKDYIVQNDAGLEENAFYRFEYIVEQDRLTLNVNGSTVVTAEVKDAFAPNQDFVFYPKHADMDILAARVEYLDGTVISDVKGSAVLDLPHWKIDTPAAYRVSSDTYKVSFLSDRVGETQRAIDEIGNVVCKQPVSDMTFTGVTYRGYDLDAADGYTRFADDSNEPFYVSFDFSVSRYDKEHPRSGFGGMYRTKHGALFAGYDFNSERFTIKNDYWAFAPETSLVYASKQQKLEPDRIYKMRAEFARDGVRLYVDGELACSTGMVGWSEPNWYVFLPGGCDANIADFEYGSLSGKVYYGMTQKLGTEFFSAVNHFEDNASFTAKGVIDSNEAITRAELMYSELNSAEKSKITNYGTLLAARAKYNELLAATSVIYGDANGDGEVNSKDIVAVREYLAALDYDTGLSTVAVSGGADANGDGEINLKDISLLRSYLAAFDYESGVSTVVLGPRK